MRARVWVRERAAAMLLLPAACTPRSARSNSTWTRAHYTLQRVSLALRISSECAVDVFAEINAAAPPDQQRFPVSCEVTGLRSELRYRPDRVSLSPPPPTGCRCRCLPPPPPPRSLRGRRAEQEKPALESALIHGETFVWSANITAKQVKYRVILCVSWRVSPHCLDRCSFMSMYARAQAPARATGRWLSLTLRPQVSLWTSNFWFLFTLIILQKGREGSCVGSCHCSTVLCSCGLWGATQKHWRCRAERCGENQTSQYFWPNTSIAILRRY